MSRRDRAIAELERNGVDWKTPLFGSHCRRLEANDQEEADSARPPLSPEALEARALDLLKENPDWPLGMFARTLCCTIADLQAIEAFVAAFTPKYECVSAFLHDTAPMVPVKDTTARPLRIQARNVPGKSEMDRRRGEIAKLRGEGVVMSKDSVYLTGEPDQRMPALNVREMSGRKDYRSPPDAREMTRDEIRNVEFLKAIELRDGLKRTAKRLGLVVAESDPREPEYKWGNWNNDDPRWTLTPHQLRKLKSRKYR